MFHHAIFIIISEGSPFCFLLSPLENQQDISSHGLFSATMAIINGKLPRRVGDERGLFRSIPMPLARRVSCFLNPLPVPQVEILVAFLRVYPLSFLSVRVTVPNTINELDTFATVVGEDASTVLDIVVKEPVGKYALPLVKLLLRSKAVEALTIHFAHATLEQTEILCNYVSASRNSFNFLHFNFNQAELEDEEAMVKGAKCLADLVLKDSHLSCLAIKRFGTKFPPELFIESGLLAALKLTKSLCYLRLRDAGIGPEAAILLAQVLETNRTIEQLGLGANPIGDRGVEAFAQSLSLNNTLQGLSLPLVGVTQKGAMSLANALYENKSLRLLYMKDDYLGPKCGKRFADMLKVNKSLHFLCLDYCDLQEAGCKAFISALAVNRSLKVLWLNFNGITWEDQVELTRVAKDGGVLERLEVSDINLLEKDLSGTILERETHHIVLWNKSYASHLMSRQRRVVQPLTS